MRAESQQKGVWRQRTTADGGPTQAETSAVSENPNSFVIQYSLWGGKRREAVGKVASVGPHFCLWSSFLTSSTTELTNDSVLDHALLRCSLYLTMCGGRGLTNFMSPIIHTYCGSIHWTFVQLSRCEPFCSPHPPFAAIECISWSATSCGKRGAHLRHMEPSVRLWHRARRLQQTWDKQRSPRVCGPSQSCNTKNITDHYVRLEFHQHKGLGFCPGFSN